MRISKNDKMLKETMSPENNNTINYKSLELMFSTKGLLANNNKGLYFVTSCIIFGTVVMFFKLFFLGIALIVGGILYIIKLQNNRAKLLWRRFAYDNRWLVTAPDLTQITLPPTIDAIGRFRYLSEVIEGNYNGTEFKLYTYQFTVGTGKSSQTYTYTVFDVVLQSQLPSFLLDGRNGRALNTIPAGYEKISLEGDFDKQFQLYALKGTVVEVLSVISPDVMHTLTTYNTKQDIQSVGNNLWFLQAGDMRSVKNLPDMFAAVSFLMPEFYHRLKTYKQTANSV